MQATCLLPPEFRRSSSLIMAVLSAFLIPVSDELRL
jgi:hypothetical protein